MTGEAGHQAARASLGLTRSTRPVHAPLGVDATRPTAVRAASALMSRRRCAVSTPVQASAAGAQASAPENNPARTAAGVAASAVGADRALPASDQLVAKAGRELDVAYQYHLGKRTSPRRDSSGCAASARSAGLSCISSSLRNRVTPRKGRGPLIRTFPPFGLPPGTRSSHLQSLPRLFFPVPFFLFGSPEDAHTTCHMHNYFSGIAHTFGESRPHTLRGCSTSIIL